MDYPFTFPLQIQDVVVAEIDGTAFIRPTDKGDGWSLMGIQLEDLRGKKTVDLSADDPLYDRIRVWLAAQHEEIVMSLWIDEDEREFEAEPDNVFGISGARL